MKVVGVEAHVERALLGCASIVLLSMVFAYARADDHPVARLAYERDASARQCPDEPELRDLVSARLGYVPFRDDAPNIVTTRIEGTPRGLRATVEARNEAGEITGRREIVSRTRDCQELARGVALAISVAIDPFVLTGGAPPPAPGTDAGIAEAAVEVPVVDAGVQAPVEVPDAGEPIADDAGALIPFSEPEALESEHRDGLGLALGGAVGMGFGAVPDPRPYLALDLALTHPYFLLRGVVRFDMPASDSRPIGGSVTAWRVLARIDACGAYRFLFGCAGLGARTYVAHGDDIANSRSGHRTSFAVTPQVGVRIPVSDALRLHAAVGLDLPLEPVSLELDDRPVFREAKVSPFLELGIAWRIP